MECRHPSPLWLTGPVSFQTRSLRERWWPLVAPISVPQPAGLALDADGYVGTMIADTQVLFDGVASPLLFASSGQVNAVVPFGVAAGHHSGTGAIPGRNLRPLPVAVAPSAIGIFSADASGVGPAILLNQDGSINSPDRPAAPDSVVTIWATGVGQFSPAGIDGAVVGLDTCPCPYSLLWLRSAATRRRTLCRRCPRHDRGGHTTQCAHPCRGPNRHCRAPGAARRRQYQPAQLSSP